MIKKYLWKDIYLQKKDRKLLITQELTQWHHNGISKNTKFVRQYTKSTNQIQEKNWVEINDQSGGT